MGRSTWLVLLALWGLLGGCSLRPTLRLDLHGGSDMNGGLPFHLLVRSVSSEQFRGESYAEVARLAAQSDKSVLRSEVLVAPRDHDYAASFSIAPPKEGGVGVYFLFTNPTGSWRLLLERPLPKVLPVQLGPSGIRRSDSGAR